MAAFVVVVVVSGVGSEKNLQMSSTAEPSISGGSKSDRRDGERTVARGKSKTWSVILQKIKHHCGLEIHKLGVVRWRRR